jgi:hypothetical protein
MLVQNFLWGFKMKYLVLDFYLLALFYPRLLVAHWTTGQCVVWVTDSTPPGEHVSVDRNPSIDRSDPCYHDCYYSHRCM